MRLYIGGWKNFNCALMSETRKSVYSCRYGNVKPEPRFLDIDLWQKPLYSSCRERGHTRQKTLVLIEKSNYDLSFASLTHPGEAAWSRTPITATHAVFKSIVQWRSTSHSFVLCGQVQIYCMKEKLPTDSILAQRICSAEEVLRYPINHRLPMMLETYSILYTRGIATIITGGDCVTPHFSGKNHYVLRALFCLAAVWRKKCRELHKIK